MLRRASGAGAAGATGAGAPGAAGAGPGTAGATDDASPRRPPAPGDAPLALEVGPGDDCAILAADGFRLAVSTDISVEDVHFRRDWLRDDEVGYRAATAALSDLAAVAARPVGLLVSLALPPGAAEEVAMGIMEGIGRAADAAGAVVLGGDVSRSREGVVIDVAVLGTTPAPVLRSGASPGDEVWVTGRLGGAAAAVEAWAAGREPSPGARAAYASPVARVAEALWLAERGLLRAMIDLSDGLAGDLGHLAAASGVAIVVDMAAVPVHPAAREGDVRAGAREGDRGGPGEAGDGAALRRALGGGEDYELCFAASPGVVDPITADFEACFGIPLTRIGVVEAGAGVWRRGPDGGRAPLQVAGYSHFGEGA